MRRMTRILAMLLVLLLLCACGQPAVQTPPAEPEPEPETDVPEPEAPDDNPYVLTRLRMIGRGEGSEDYKLAFFEPETLEGVEAFLVCYSIRPQEEVWDYLSGLSLAELLALDKPVNRAYVITDLSYCDGVGNTLNTAQKDVVTGEAFSEAGVHTFYAATVGADGVLALAAAPQTITIAETAGNLAYTRDGETVSGTFQSSIGGEIDRNFVLISHQGYAAVRDLLADRQTLDGLEKIGSALGFANAEETAFTLDLTTLHTAEGTAPDPEQVLYVYVASASQEAVIGLSYSDTQLLTPEQLPQSSGTIGTGKGILFPNGGAAKLGGGRGSILSTRQAIFDSFPEKPRIAILGAASGTERELWEYFYVDTEGKESFQTRLTDAGFEPVYVPLTAENRKTVGEDPYFAALIGSCHGVYLTGGDQSLGMAALTRDDGSLNAAGQALADLFARGGLLAGTSAGAHMLGDLCFQDAGSLESLANPIPQQANPAADGVVCGPEGVTYAGLPFALEAAGCSVTFDSHFGARGRLGRLAVMQHAGGADLAIGLDEATGFAISDGVGTVYGAGSVTILDGRNAVYDGSETHFAVDGLQATLLSAGDRFDFRTGTLLPADAKAPAAGTAQAELPEQLLEADGAQSRALITFAASGEQSVTHTAAVGTETFRIVFEKTDAFAAFTGSKTYAGAGLTDLPRTAATGFLIRIR